MQTYENTTLDNLANVLAGLGKQVPANPMLFSRGTLPESCLIGSKTCPSKELCAVKEECPQRLSDTKATDTSGRTTCAQ